METSSREIEHLYSAPPRWDDEDFDKLLLWATDLGASDIQVLPNRPIIIRHHGRWKACTEKITQSSEIDQIIESLGGTSAISQIKAGSDVDTSYEIRISRTKKARFRVNISGTPCSGNISGALVLRTIPATPPTIKDMDIEQEIIDAMYPANGLFLVTGVMGSGKSTFLGGVIGDSARYRDDSIITYESPIEFDFMSIPDVKAPVAQTEIPRHLSSFKMAPRNAARRAADIILVGESRDQETLRGMIESAEIGVTAYSTVHTSSVAETPTRIINVFSHEERNQVAITLISSLRVIVQQRLLPRIGGGRVAIREFLVFTPDLRDKLMVTPIEKLIPTIQGMVEEHGQSLLATTQKAYEGGLIEKGEYTKVREEVQRHKLNHYED